MSLAVRSSAPHRLDEARIYTVTELNQNTARVLEEIERRGKSAAVTRHGKFLAMITPLAGAKIESAVLTQGPLAQDFLREAAKVEAIGWDSEELLSDEDVAAQVQAVTESDQQVSSQHPVEQPDSGEWDPARQGHSPAAAEHAARRAASERPAVGGAAPDIGGHESEFDRSSERVLIRHRLDEARVYTVSVLNQNTASVLAEINASGQVAAVTRYGKFLAMITPLAGVKIESVVLTQAPLAQDFLREAAEIETTDWDSTDLLTDDDAEEACTQSDEEELDRRRREEREELARHRYERDRDEHR